MSHTPTKGGMLHFRKAWFPASYQVTVDACFLASYRVTVKHGSQQVIV